MGADRTKPDGLLRVFMAWKPHKREEQTFWPFYEGFTGRKGSAESGFDASKSTCSKRIRTQ